jgi:Spy/CpxP family protein refolding chaperone
MHPGFMGYWRRQRCAESGAWNGSAYAGCYGPRAGGSPPHWSWAASGQFGDSLFGAAGFGTRRPLRFLAMRLDLDDAQVARVAKIVERLRVEREQGAVDLRRAAGELADALEGDALDPARVEEASRLRVEAARRVQDAVVRALRELHALLGAEQRDELASLIRSGALRL